MESPESPSSDALDKLEGITSHLENQIGSFRLIGKDIQGDIESGFVLQDVVDEDEPTDETEE